MINRTFGFSHTDDSWFTHDGPAEKAGSGSLSAVALRDASVRHVVFIAIDMRQFLDVAVCGGRQKDRRNPSVRLAWFFPERLRSLGEVPPEVDL